MKIQITEQESIYNGVEVHAVNSLNFQKYVRHNIDVFNIIVIDGVEHEANYQTGCRYKSDQTGMPSEDLELSDYSTSPFLKAINDSCDYDDFTNAYDDDYPAITEFKFDKIKAALQCNLPELEDFCDYSNEPEDYHFSESAQQWEALENCD